MCRRWCTSHAQTVFASVVPVSRELLLSDISQEDVRGWDGTLGAMVKDKLLVLKYALRMTTDKSGIWSGSSKMIEVLSRSILAVHIVSRDGT